jgi:hypothetical protein
MPVAQRSAKPSSATTVGPVGPPHGHRPHGWLRHYAALLGPDGAVAPKRACTGAARTARGDRASDRSSTCDLDCALALGATQLPLPLHLGHECVADVLEVGERVSTVKPPARSEHPHRLGRRRSGGPRRAFSRRCDQDSADGVSGRGFLRDAQARLMAFSSGHASLSSHGRLDPHRALVCRRALLGRVPGGGDRGRGGASPQNANQRSALELQLGTLRILSARAGLVGSLRQRA